MSLPELFANPFFTQLAEACTSNATTITVQKAAPEALQKEGQFRVLLGAAEYALVTGGFTSNGKTWTVTRGVESTAVSHAQGEEVLHLLTAGSLGSQSDAAAGVPSLRTLGPDAQQAAPGTTKAEAEAGAEVIAEAVAAAGVAVEKGRAEGAESALAVGLGAEITRAEAAEGSNSTAITTEKTRAETAEATKASSTALTTETSARETAVSAEKGARETADSTHAALTTTAHGGIVAGTDSRLTNARTPTAHASTHAEAGSDPLTTADLPSSVVNGSTAVLDVRQFLAGGVVDWAAALKAMEEQRKALLTPLDIALKEGPVLGNKEHVTGNVATFKYHFIFEGCPTITLPVMAEGQYATRFNETAEGVNVNAALYKHPDIILDGDFRIAGSGSGDGGSFMSAYRRTFAVNGVMSGENYKNGVTERGYTDHTFVKGVHTDHTVTGYALQSEEGDGKVIAQVMAFAGKGYLGKHGSGVFACPVSGTHEFDAASFTLLQNHLEGDGPNEVGGKTTSPLLLFRGGVYKVQDSRLYTLANPARPCIEVDDTEVANRATDLTLDMTRFLQRLDEPGAAGEAEPGGNLLGVAIKLKGFSKQSTLKLINVRGECFQQTSAASQFDSRSKIGIRIESDDEGLQTQLTNRRVMIASTDCIIRYNTSTSSWEVRPLGGNNDSVTTHRFSTPNLVLSKFASGSTQAKAAPTTRAAGKHYYRGYAVDDRGRKTNMGAEKLVTLAAGEVPNVEIEAGQACRFILEHGTAEGVFTDWVEIVLPQGQAYLADMGSAIGGAAWSTEGKPTAQTTAAAENNTATGRVLLDSNGVAESFGPEIPTTGSWQKAGDLYTLTPSGIRCVCATSAIANNGGTWIALLVGANELTAGESTVPRESAAATTIAATTKLLRLAFFTARKSETIKTLRVVTTATAAAATPSLIRLGVYSVSEAGALALVASTPSDTTLLAAANTRYSKNLSATWAKVAGSRYAIGLLVVTTAAAPTIAAISSSVGSTEAGESPRLCAAQAEQTDLPAEIEAASLTNSASIPYFSMTP